MAHELDFSTGRAGMAYRSDVRPWHGLGESIEPGESIEHWLERAGLNWTAERRAVRYADPSNGPGGLNGLRTLENAYVLSRSDTGAGLGIVTDRYKVFQPREVMEFHKQLMDSLGFELKTAGALRDGRIVWAMAEVPGTVRVQDEQMRLHLLASTSYDGTRSTRFKYVAECVVCANTLGVADAEHGAGEVVVGHVSRVDVRAVHDKLGLGSAWADHVASAELLAQTPVTAEQSVDILCRAYFDKPAAELQESAALDGAAITSAQIRKMLERVGAALDNAPGATLDARRGTAWGAVGAVTWDVDHTIRAHSDGNRLASAWWGRGDAIKTRALNAALELAAAA